MDANLLLLPDHPNVASELRAAAKTQISTVLLGETGVGKEYVADWIHRESSRRGKQFVKFNCVGFSEHVIDSELFGHVRGAFTGAVDNRIGLLEQAHGGTLLIDEIGDMPVSLQAKLLRFMQDGEVRPVGSNAVRKVDARLIFATRRDLDDLVRRGDFRDDLYYRIADWVVTIPALRVRQSEIKGLSDLFIGQANAEFKASCEGFGDVMVARLRNELWPGNIRELRSYCRRYVLKSL